MSKMLGAILLLPLLVIPTNEVPFMLFNWQAPNPSLSEGEGAVFSGKAIYRARCWSSSCRRRRRSSLVGGSARGLCFFNLEPAMVVGAGVRGGGWPGSEGWLVGGAAAGEVAGGRGGGGRRRP